MSDVRHLSDTYQIAKRNTFQEGGDEGGEEEEEKEEGAEKTQDASAMLLYTLLSHVPSS